MDELLRGIAKRVSVHSALDIPEHGFGETEITGRSKTGMATEVVLRAFVLSCKCLVRHHYECGGVCFGCRSEIEQIIEEADESLTVEQTDWMSTPCKKHYKVCEYSFCDLGGCSRHIALSPDGHYYCPDHFKEVSNELDLLDIEEKKGPGRAQFQRFLRTLFFD